MDIVAIITLIGCIAFMVFLEKIKFYEYKSFGRHMLKIFGFTAFGLGIIFLMSL